MNYLLGIDFGGGASKATLLSKDGTIAAEAVVEYPTSYPKPGWAEQNPSDWYQALRENVKTIFQKSGAAPSEIAAVALDAATHTAVLTDAAFRPLRPAIYWTDTRCAEEAEFLKNEYGHRISEIMYHQPDTIWTLPQLLWIKRNEPDVWRNTKRILFAKDYVRHQLTGDFVTDRIEAEGSMLFDYRTMEWSEELLSLLGLGSSALPSLLHPADLAGRVTPRAAQETGLAEGTPVLCGTTDTVMEVFASGAVRQKQMTVKLATAGRICVVTDKPYPSRHLVNYSHVIDGLWYPGTATKSSAASLRWYRDAFGGTYGEIDRAAVQVAVGCDGLTFHPYLTGELTPYGDPELRGSFVGISAGHTKAHFDRAVLEGVAFSLLDCKWALDQLHIPYETEARMIGGGSKSPLWRQILADCLNLTLIEKECSDSSLGSAMLAGIAVGIFPSFAEAVRLCSRVKSITRPNAENHEAYQKCFALYRQIHDALAPVYHNR